MDSSTTSTSSTRGKHRRFGSVSNSHRWKKRDEYRWKKSENATEKIRRMPKKLTQPSKLKAQSIGMAHVVAAVPAVNSIFGQLEEIFSNFLG
jgi:hypothetical protein